MYAGHSTTINGKVYFGGGMASDNDKYLVYCYNPSQDQWFTLPPLPVRYFRLGEVEGKLVAIGGLSKATREYCSTVHSYDEALRKWQQVLPPMPTARHTPVVVSFKSALVVAGGTKEGEVYASAVEIYLTKTSQWFKTDPVPAPCQGMSAAATENALYAVGGYCHPSFLNQSWYASVDELLHNAVPASQAVHRTRSRSYHSAWKILPNTPFYTPATAVIAGSFIVIGGYNTPQGDGTQNEVYMYSSSAKCWIHVSKLLEPRSNATAAMISPTEILIIGGWHNGPQNTVYKGTLTLVV